MFASTAVSVCTLTVPVPRLNKGEGRR